MEVGVWPVPQWYAARQGKALINFGASSGHLPARMAVMHDSGTLLPRDAAVNRAATTKEQQEIYGRVRQGLDDGALGIGLGIAYVPKATREEILQLFQLAAEYKVARLCPHAKWRSCRTGSDRCAAGSYRGCRGYWRFASCRSHHQHGHS